MPEFGIIIIKNPGPTTELSIDGLAGWADESTDSAAKCLERVKEAESEGHKAWVVVAFNANDGDGSIQVELADEDYLKENEHLSDDEVEDGDADSAEREDKT